MGVVIRPEERDQRNISRLTLTYDRGEFETPNRMVTKNDINAKSGLGADIPLTSLRNLFICEEKINLDVLNNIIHKNGYLAEFILKLDKSLDRVENTNAMKVVFPSVTKEVADLLLGNKNAKERLINFILQLMSEEKVDLYLLQIELIDDQILSYLNSQEVQYAPVLDIHDDKLISRWLPNFISFSPSNVPLIGFTYASYKNANLSYDFLISELDKIHEANKGIITVGAPRTVGKEEYYADVSAPHYSSFLVSDIVAEMYYHSFYGGRRLTSVRIFEKKDLTVSPVSDKHDITEHSGEDNIFASDKSLKDLFFRTISAKNTEEDFKKSRPSYMSRVHETIQTAEEYEKMRKSIINHELLEYRRSKIRMNDLLDHQGLVP